MGSGKLYIMSKCTNFNECKCNKLGRITEITKIEGAYTNRVDDLVYSWSPLGVVVCIIGLASWHWHGRNKLRKFHNLWIYYKFVKLLAPSYFEFLLGSTFFSMTNNSHNHEPSQRSPKFTHVFLVQNELFFLPNRPYTKTNTPPNKKSNSYKFCIWDLD